MRRPTPAGGAASAFAALRQLARTSAPEEVCELCGARLAPAHQHLLALDSRQLACTCDACTLLFSKPGAGAGKYRRVPRRLERLADFRISDADWAALLIPVGMAFMFYNTAAGRVMAYYPSPAGPTESSHLPAETWQRLAAENPALASLEPDVEALLVNRVGAHRDYYLAPIDRCYELVGVIRSYWSGLSGGTEVWRQIEDYFGRLEKHARVVEARHA